MSRIHPFCSVNSTGAGTPSNALDTKASRGSGDLAIAYGNYGAGTYDCDFSVEQAPTVSGPWTPVPLNPTGTVTGSNGSTVNPGFVLVPIQWSAQFLRVTLSPGNSNVATAALIRPGANSLE